MAYTAVGTTTTTAALITTTGRGGLNLVPCDFQPGPCDLKGKTFFYFLNFHGSSSWRSLPLSHCTNHVCDKPSVSRPHICTSLSQLWVKIPSSRMSKREFSFADLRPSRVAKKTVSYCDTSDSELEFDEDGYERFKTKSFKKKAYATDSDEFELGPDAGVEDESITYVMLLSEMESEDEEMIGLKRKKNSNVVSLTHTVGTGAGVTFCCNVGFQFRMQDATDDGKDGVRCTPQGFHLRAPAPAHFANVFFPNNWSSHTPHRRCKRKRRCTSTQGIRLWSLLMRRMRR